MRGFYGESAADKAHFRKASEGSKKRSVRTCSAS